MMPDPAGMPKGCKFCERCKYASKECESNIPLMTVLEGTHQVRCFRYRNGQGGK
jgi:peptide/nickel transport system ATP-binding protein